MPSIHSHPSLVKRKRKLLFLPGHMEGKNCI
jgi:hypothetical protein